MPTELEIVRVPLGATIQDAGRQGWLASGVPHRARSIRSRTRQRTSRWATLRERAAVEIPLGPMVVRARGDLSLSVDGRELATLLADRRGAPVDACERAVRYLAVRGALDVPVVLGARATLAMAQIGGLHGRPLRPGDTLPVAMPEGSTAALTAGPSVTMPPRPALLRVLAGPHARRFPPGALEALLAITWTVSARSDRVGVRLEGGHIPRAFASSPAADLDPPVPMVRGVIQIVTDGTPIVLGPDHPVTGGYPVLGVLPRASQAILARLRPGHPLAFRRAETPTGRNTR